MAFIWLRADMTKLLRRMDLNLMCMTCVETLSWGLFQGSIAQYLPMDKQDQVKHSPCLVLIGKIQFHPKALLSRSRIKTRISSLMRILMGWFQEVFLKSLKRLVNKKMGASILYIVHSYKCIMKSYMIYFKIHKVRNR